MVTLWAELFSNERIWRSSNQSMLAADAGGLGLDHAQHRDGGDCRVQRIAAGPHHVECGQRGGRHRGCRHRAGRIHRTSAGQMKIAHRQGVLLLAASIEEFV
jgi:hypothetical protein